MVGFQSSKWVFAVTGVVLILRPPAFAFRPTSPGHAAITEDSLCGFQTGICNQAFLPDDCSQGITRTVDNELLKFTARARRTIATENQNVDFYNFKGVAEHFDDEHFRNGDGRGPGEGASDRLIQLKRDVITEITSPTPSALAARQRLGQALHTVQDFYAHSNWVETFHSSINTDLGINVFDPLPKSTATCGVSGGDPLLVGVTTGYFALTAGLVPTCDFPPGKCRHGVEVLCPEGLNKDTPSRPHYCAARELAVEATTDYVNQILDAAGVGGNRKAIATLTGARTFAVALDNSCPMGDPIYWPDLGERVALLEIAKGAIASAVSRLRGTPDEPTRYLLEPFNDGSWGPLLTTSNADEFLHAVNAVRALPCNWAGSICLYPNCLRDHSQRALMQTVPKLDDGDKVFLIVYGVPPEIELGLAPLVSHTASELHAVIEPVLLFPYDYVCFPPGCTVRQAYNDAAYERNAEDTGGRRHLIDADYFGEFVELVKMALTGRVEPPVSAAQSPHAATVAAAPSLEAGVFLLRVSGTLGTVPQDFFVPIDPSLGRVSFAGSIESATVAVFRPSGAQVTPADPGVTIGNAFVAVDAPEPGQWRLQVSGSGSFSASVEARSAIDFVGFDFVALGGRPEHEGLVPIRGQPVTGTAPLGMATLFGPYATAVFEVVSESGASIAPLSLSANAPNASAHEFVGTVTIPSVPFRVAAFGTDAGGFAYRRIFPTRFRGQTVHVDEDLTVRDLPAGATSTLSFKVTNFGLPDTFNIVAADDAGFVSAVRPTSLALSSGSSGVAQVDIVVPPMTPAGRLLSISAGATSTTDAALQNAVTAFHAVSACGAWRRVQVSVDHARLTHKLKIKGTFTLPPSTAFADLDPGVTGLRLIVENHDGEFKVDTTIPPGLFDGLQGWSPSGSRWRYRNDLHDPSTANGVSAVEVRDLSYISPGLVSVAVFGRNGSYPFDVGDMPLAVTVLLNDRGACGRHAFTPAACSGIAGRRVRCR